MRRVTSVVLGVRVLVSVGFAQSPASKAPTFAVASIKPNADITAPLSFRVEPDGSIAAGAITLQRLLMTAYNVPGFRIVGGPDWMTSSRWNVQARPESALALEQFRRALQTLLADRFRLGIHTERRTSAVYELVADGRTRKIYQSNENAAAVLKIAPGSINMIGVTAATFASQLSYALARPVIDKTNLSGRFDFALEWTPEPGEDDGPTTAGLPRGTIESAPRAGGPSIFTALREKLGLRLKPARAPVDVIVVDHAEPATPD